MNEGWASYWHLRIMRELDLSTEEVVEFAKLNASVLQPSRHSLNPYHLGVKIFEDIERRWDAAKLFEVREYDMDTSFIRNYLTKELVEELDLYVFEKQGPSGRLQGSLGRMCVISSSNRGLTVGSLIYRRGWRIIRTMARCTFVMPMKALSLI